MQKRISLLLSVFSLIFILSASAQEREHPLTFNALQRVQSMKEKTFSPNGLRGGGSLNLPFFDDFAQYSLPTSDPAIPTSWQRWSDTSAYINQSFADAPPTLGVASLDGLDGHGYPYNFSNQFSFGSADTMTSLPIDLSTFGASDQVYLMFMYQAGGLCNSPDETDSLVLEFFSPFGAGEWFHRWSVPGTSDATFQTVFIPITEPEYLLNGFRFRFRNYATLSGAFDMWNIDYVFMNQGINPDNFLFDEVSMQYPTTTLLNEYTSMPWTHFVSNPLAFMSSTLIAKEKNLGATQNIVTGYKIGYEGVFQNFPNQFFNTFGNANQDIESPIDLGGFVYDTSVNDTCAIFDVCTYINPTDANLPNDTACFQQIFNNYYAYDDGSAERAYSIEAAGGNVAVKYRAEIADTLLGVFIHWIPYGVDVSLQTFLLRVWADGGGSPGAQIEEQFGYHSPHFYNDGYDIFSYYPLDNPLSMEAGNFYIGWTQPNAIGLNVGNDKNTSTNPTKLFYNLGFGQSWEQSQIEGSVMIRPVFKSGKSGVWNSISENEVPAIKVFPNPADHQLNIQMPNTHSVQSIEMFDLSGRKVWSDKIQVEQFYSMDISELPASIYLLTVTDQESGKRFQQKIIVQ